MILQEKIFSKYECEKIISYHKVYTSMGDYYPYEKHLKINGNRLEAKNGGFKYNTYPIPYDNETYWFFDKLLNWFSKTSKIKLNRKVQFCTLHKYELEDCFKKHIDLNQEFINRRYNLGIQLNENYLGGEYICWDDYNNEISISKEQGTAVAYHCKVPHEIKEIKSGERWSIVMPIYKLNIFEIKNKLI